MTKYFEDRNKFRKEETPIVAGSEWTRDPKREYICSYCRRTLHRLADKNGLNESFFCSFCSIESLPEEDLRSKSKIAPPERIDNSDNPSVSYAPEVGIKRKNKEPKGTFRTLQERGIKITNYSEKGWRKESND